MPPLPLYRNHIASWKMKRLIYNKIRRRKLSAISSKWFINIIFSMEILMLIFQKFTLILLSSFNVLSEEN